MKKKRLLSWFLAMVMVLGLLPMTAWAEEIPFTVIEGEALQEQLPEDSNSLPVADLAENPEIFTKPEDMAKAERINVLMENIAASYVENSGEWVIMDMAAYEDLNPDGSKTSEDAKQAYIKKAIESINKESVGETAYTKAILALTSIGINAEELYPAGSETAISAIAGLNGKEHSSSAWVAPYTLMAYNQKEYAGTEEYVTDLLKAVLTKKIVEKINGEDAIYWSEWGTVQTTANMLSALAFCKNEEDISDVIDAAVTYLSYKQLEDGSFEDGYGSEANTTALVIIGLCAVGVNPDTDGRFIKNGESVLDALLNFAFEDNSGFKYNSESKKGDSNTVLATEQAFRALIAAKQVMDTGKAFNIYDFSHNAGSLVPGYAEDVVDEPVIPDKPEDDDITVKVSIKAIDEYWMKNKSVTIEEDSTVYDAFMEALEDSDIEQEGAEDGYIESMTKDGETLGEFDEGENSGWLYKVNGDLPDVGIQDYELEDGDKILFYYTQDWKKDPDAGSRKEDEEDEEEEIPEEIVEEEVLEEMQPEVQLPAIEETYTDISADVFYYEAAQWAVAEGIASGVTETEFGADWTCSRGQLMTLIWRMMGSPAPETKVVPYIDVDQDMYYHDAILWAAENGFANGTDGISFSPEMTLTRGQAVTFLWRAAGCPAAEGTAAFIDVAKGEYYYDAILWAVENGITSGTGEGMFSPDAPCTRGQIVTFLYRAFAE